MDVRITENTPYPASFNEKLESISGIVEQNLEANAEETDQSSVEDRQVQQKVMMDLQDVQRFLYMLIGSDIKVKTENEAVGYNVNLVA